MEQKAFDLITEKLLTTLESQGFTQQKEILKEKNGHAVLFTSENLAYSVLFNGNQNRFELRSAAMTDDGPEETWKTLSSWLFDPAEDNASAAESIANDFVDTVQGPKRVAALQTAKKKRKKDDENNPSPVFFFNRCVSLLPGLNDELIHEKAAYPQVRAVVFAREKVLPRVEELAANGAEDQVKKLCDLLNDMYERGDMDVRSIITIVLLNSLSNAALKKLEPEFSDDLRASSRAALKFKGKTVKPEKKKKQKRYVADTLSKAR